MSRQGQADEAYWAQSHRAEGRSAKIPFLMCCNKEIVYHGFLCFSSIAVTVTQATVLNFFIIAFFREYNHSVSLNPLKFQFVTYQARLWLSKLGVDTSIGWA